MLHLGKYIFRLFCLLNFHKLPTRRFGTHYGGWLLPEHSLPEIKSLWSAGAGEDISFEVDLISEFSQMNITIFDPTPPAIDHIKAFFAGNQAGKGTLINNGKKRHPLDSEGLRYRVLSGEVENKIKFHAVGWSGKPMKLKFYFPKIKGMISYSTENKTDHYVTCDCLPVSQILKENPGLWQDPVVIKMDIEGSEYEVIEDLARHRITPAILLFEIHLYSWKNFLKLFKTIYILLFKGYQCFYMDGDNYGFIRKSHRSS